MEEKHIHFIGIGGISMSTLAAIALKKGYRVTGSDRAMTPLTEKLAAMGIQINCPQSAENIEAPDAVVYTAAIREDNPELAEAQRRGIPCIVRSKYLGELMQAYPCRIGVSGTHGKSSTTGMLAHIFIKAGKDPIVACGAELPELHGAYRLGSGEHFIYEACEYKDSFLDFHPTIAVMLNMEMDHVDYYRSMEQMEESYIRSAKEAGAVVANWDDPRVRSAASSLKNTWVVKVSTERTDADYLAKDIRLERGLASFDLLKGSRKLCRICLKVPGIHHVHNGLCAAAVAHICGISEEDIAAGLSDYKGVLRRFEYKGNFNGAEIYDDYAHHPTEIAVTLAAAREMKGEKGRLFCVFQPHTYSRTAGLFGDFVTALSGCDRLILAPIYAAREQNTFGVSSEQLAERIPGACVMESFEEIAEQLAKELREGDILLTMGAGNAYRTGEYLLNKETDRR